MLARRAYNGILTIARSGVDLMSEVSSAPRSDSDVLAFVLDAMPCFSAAPDVDSPICGAEELPAKETRRDIQEFILYCIHN